MDSEKSTLKIKAERLGTVDQVTKFLSDLEHAYNSIYTFDFIVDKLSNDKERASQQFEERYHRLRKLWKEFEYRKDYPPDFFFAALFGRLLFT